MRTASQLTLLLQLINYITEVVSIVRLHETLFTCCTVCVVFCTFKSFHHHFLALHVLALLQIFPALFYHCSRHTTVDIVLGSFVACFCCPTNFRSLVCVSVILISLLCRSLYSRCSHSTMTYRTSKLEN